METNNNTNTDTTTQSPQHKTNYHNPFSSPEKNQSRFTHTNRDNQEPRQYQNNNRTTPPRPSPDRSSLPPNALMKTIDPQLKPLYKAAGIIFYAYSPSSSNNSKKLMILLGAEDRAKKHPGETEVWCHFGGKIETEDGNDPTKTALREFHEETAKMFLEPSLSEFAESMSSQMESETSYKYWWSHGKYIIFFVQVPFISDIASKYKQLDRTQNPFNDKDQLGWIEWTTLKSLSQWTPRSKSSTPKKSPKTKPQTSVSDLADEIQNLQLKSEDNNNTNNNSTQEKVENGSAESWVLSHFFKELISGGHIRRHLDSLDPNIPKLNNTPQKHIPCRYGSTCRHKDTTCQYFHEQPQTETASPKS